MSIEPEKEYIPALENLKDSGISM